NDIYLITLYYAEDGFSSHLKRIMSVPIDEEVPTADLLKIAGEVEESDVISYGDEQFTAISQAINSKVMILTVGPVTNKTTVIKDIIQSYSNNNDLSTESNYYKNAKDIPYIITAQTGRASKRLHESTGIKASIINSLL